MGRLAVKDLEKVAPTAEEVTIEATKNAAKQDVNGTNATVQEVVDVKSKTVEELKTIKENLDKQANEAGKKLAEKIGDDGVKGTSISLLLILIILIINKI